jgi:hypothetical protein
MVLKVRRNITAAPPHAMGKVVYLTSKRAQS